MDKTHQTGNCEIETRNKLISQVRQKRLRRGVGEARAIPPFDAASTAATMATNYITYGKYLVKVTVGAAAAGALGLKSRYRAWYKGLPQYPVATMKWEYMA